MKFLFGPTMGLTLIGTTVLIIVFMYSEINFMTWTAIALGFSFALIYVLTGFISFSIALKKENKSFAKIISISVIARLITLLAAIALLFKFFQIDRTVFIISVLIFYFIFQIIEIVSFNKVEFEKPNL